MDALGYLDEDDDDDDEDDDDDNEDDDDDDIYYDNKEDEYELIDEVMFNPIYPDFYVKTKKYEKAGGLKNNIYVSHMALPPSRSSRTPAVSRSISTTCP